MDIKTIAVIGASPAGCAFARVAALGGYATVLEDVSREMRDRGLASIKSSLAASVKRADLSASKSADAWTRVSAASTVESAIRDADLIVEAVPEELEMKLELFTVFDKFAKPGAIFASTTSTLSVREISDVTICRDRCIGMRLRDADPKNSVMELIRTGLTSEETFLACMAAGVRMVKQVRLLWEPPA